MYPSDSRIGELLEDIGVASNHWGIEHEDMYWAHRVGCCVLSTWNSPNIPGKLCEVLEVHITCAVDITYNIDSIKHKAKNWYFRYYGDVK